ncbi:hypothetical protein AB0F93_00210 [Micromonospora tulbaghiae]|uniref:hypothetical protein n=1 Tax=Micromonospora tulbaghiae TaxID=479978 RepID=UPI00331ACC49
MPRRKILAPNHDPAKSLGWLATAWMEFFVRHGPGDVQGQPVVHGEEYTEVIVNCYAVGEHARNNHLLYDSSFLSRPKGCDKSGLAGRICLFEAFGPARFAGWARGGETYTDPYGFGFEYVYEPGEPMGRPVKAPFIRIMATEENQSNNTFRTVYYNLTDRDCPLYYWPGHDAVKREVFLADGGEIRTSTASSASKDGGLETHATMDEALALDTPLRTPTGWTTMGAVEVGDQLVGSGGRPVTVVKVTDVMVDRDCYRVRLPTGGAVVASAGHLWWARRPGGPAAVLTTEQMAAAGGRWQVPCVEGTWATLWGIERVGSVPVRCVGVDSADHLFQAGPGGRWLTHNTHLYETPELKEMRNVVAANMWKRKRGAGTWFFETTTMFEPGADSAAEETFNEAMALVEGRKKRGSHRLYFDHRWGECPDLTDEQMLRQAIRDAYGDALAWMDIDSLVDSVYDTRTSEARVRRYMLNAKTSSKDAWLREHEWDACGRKDVPPLADGDLVVLGGDGSWNNDATAIVATRVSDGHMELLGCWEQPEGPEGEEWQVDREAVDACVADAMNRFDVAGFYFDPPHWSDYLARWTSQWGHLMKVQASRQHPLDWWTNRPTQVVHALAEFHTAVLEKRVSYTKYPPEMEPYDERARRSLTLKRHALNARREPRRSGLHIRKESPKSAKKIDAIMAAVLSWQCRQDAIEGGILNEPEEQFFMPYRIR